MNGKSLVKGWDFEKINSIVLHYLTPDLLLRGALVQRIPLTPEGFKKIQEELDKLLKVDRPKNIQAIAEARAHGDLSENAEYHAAKEQQSFIEGRIKELKSKLARAQVDRKSTRLNSSHQKIS